MQGFQQALNEYERRLTSPYDIEEESYDWGEDAIQREEYAELEAERLMDEIWSI